MKAIKKITGAKQTLPDEAKRQQAIDEIVTELDKAFEDVTNAKIPSQRQQGLKTAIGKLLQG